MYLITQFDFELRALEIAGHNIPAAWSTFSQPAAALVLTAVWQGAAVALGLALCLPLAPRSPARHRFAMWAAGFAVVVGLELLPLLSRLMPVRAAVVSGSSAPGLMAAAVSHPWLRLQLSVAWSLAIAALWLAASLYRAADLAIHSVHLRKLWNTAVPVPIVPASLPRSLNRLSRRTLQICTTGELERPSVIGFFAPRILIPDWLFSRLTPGELDQIVLHETEHLRRRDDWTNLLQKLCLVLFPLNPGLAWIERRLCREREMACDDGVIGITRAPRAYAACLASLAERGLQRRAGALSLGAWHARPELVRRVHSILRRNRALSPLAARAVVAAVGCILLAGATELARSPRLIAIMPAHKTASAQRAPAAPSTAKVQASSTRLASLNGRNAIAENVAAWKSRDFRRGRGSSRIASNDARLSIASSAEKNTSEAFALAKSHRAARAPAASNLRTHAAAPQLAFLATEDPALESGASPTFPGQNGFIVMSSWESLEYATPEAAPKHAGNKITQHDRSVRVAGPENALAVKRISPRITVTRMYLKIYSAGDKGSTWLVFQL
jgi:beta-lactamase regulating signal transducer with metallopeptidase domain